MAMHTLYGLEQTPLDDERPPVSPHLVEHLRRRFPLTLPSQTANRWSADVALAHTEQQRGEQSVIDYLESLAADQGYTPNQENTANEPSSPQGESSDPRRPGTRSRG